VSVGEKKTCLSVGEKAKGAWGCLRGLGGEKESRRGGCKKRQTILCNYEKVHTVRKTKSKEDPHDRNVGEGHCQTKRIAGKAARRKARSAGHCRARIANGGGGELRKGEGEGRGSGGSNTRALHEMGRRIGWDFQEDSDAGFEEGNIG